MVSCGVNITTTEKEAENYSSGGEEVEHFMFSADSTLCDRVTSEQEALIEKAIDSCGELYTQKLYHFPSNI